MDIKLSHRQPLPGSSGQRLAGQVADAFVLSTESQGLLDALLRTLPHNLVKPLSRLINSRSEKEFEQAYTEAIEAVVIEASTNVHRNRVTCPLCMDGPASAYEGENGFAYPFGLRKHLTGHQRAYECAVMAATRRRASETVNLQR